ncbi:MipA/OmpV family protein [Vibrio jasicida]|uniref:MipA/OmpV family protein n=1 Tax=Vibrio jasicida TaxID=766224 RepID=UPI0005F031D1|nr:MipA/OmpV family protein [Vibrio jasicida]
MNARSVVPFSLLFFSTTLLASQEPFGIVGGSITSGESAFSVKDTPQLGATPNLFYSGPIGFVDGSLANWQALTYLGLSANWRFAEVSNTFVDLPNGITDRDGNGYEVQLHLGRTLETWLPPFTLTPFLEVDYRDKKLSNHLYSVSAREAAASGLREFKANSTFVYQAGLIGLYEVTPSWIAITKAEFIHHDSDSTLIQRDIGWSLEVGLTYRFAGL